ncbi:non-canonical purine NTP diphosphatase [Capnocytophaga sp. ARDL2]|uniref:non-canonical purine NTP diphosphatase n=1 Tax=Capnocytophaga sp. ARDL2 TaxID=3238809 RepID=UPI00355851B7
MKILFASNNQNKANEIRKQLPSHIKIVTLQDIGCTEDIPETGTTLEENAQIKADYVTQNYQLPCFADDTGLEIDALNGEPGVYSARYAGEDKNADKNMDLVLKRLGDSTERSAQFKTVIALNINGDKHLITGVVKGEILTEKIGTEGFGYDPIFKPEGSNLSFAEMSMDEKNQWSHRGKAVAQLIQFLERISSEVK